MGESSTLTTLVLSKLEEEIERTEHLIKLVAGDKLEWKPEPDSFRVCDLLGHLLECMAGFCATLYALGPERMSHFARLRGLPVNHCCGIEEASSRIAEYADHIRQGFAILRDQDLARSVPTVFEPRGEAVLTLLLANLEHLINHKHQLFSYLKLLGVQVHTADLYSLRGGQTQG
ncbi:MAG TPA: DinB family protein [Blastocatellia bacterium]|nr:DinB family protein [Blastocatellia bacterium]